MDIKIECADYDIKEGEFIAYLFERHLRSPDMTKILAVGLVCYTLLNRLLYAGSGNVIFDGAAIIGTFLTYFILIFMAFNPIYIFATKRFIREFYKKEYLYLLEDSGFTVKGCSFILNMEWSDVKMVKTKGSSIHFITRFGIFFMSRRWFKKYQFMELKRVLTAERVRNNLW